ncbi:MULTISPECIES: phosphoribosylglycinamide formyltransferase [unclassified Oceanispirochaeta]|uniref:phosphoribosylglycinamide formyltransferase n=1 Tax=unclassified Oceanispirochaeta TaxID=2635722 RepID=UPI000E08F954|nr:MULTISPECIES: phosphoribosylglycinamide formyltransferase [unclassified Oceanispirochaeta]MBF9015578.1 phosphoribosylglycinamide formyltransferase [Oceanispirochaeta sp. M2]NPD73933.1 phosphoribosylglycinamide formyltransferase [Oceanispirochaeta sp. M1]RDG30245.1 phosphoribosylglycinamide formyltransferase [Oceanispirochaeta sp. M1]
MFKIAVLISGGGSNLQSLIDASNSGNLGNGIITTVISDRSAYGLERAAASDISCYLIDRKVHKRDLSEKIMEKIPIDTDLIVLAGYLSILSPEFVSAWQGKIINIHPALLPDFGGKGMYGMNVHRAVVEAGRRKSGCSVHFVEIGVDTGKIILQKEVPVENGDSPEDLQDRILVQEHIALVEAVNILIKQSQ